MPEFVSMQKTVLGALAAQKEKSQFLEENSFAVHQIYSNASEDEIISSCPYGPTHQHDSFHKELRI